MLRVITSHSVITLTFACTNARSTKSFMMLMHETNVKRITRESIVCQYGDDLTINLLLHP